MMIKLNNTKPISLIISFFHFSSKVGYDLDKKITEPLQSILSILLDY